MKLILKLQIKKKTNNKRKGRKQHDKKKLQNIK